MAPCALRLAVIAAILSCGLAHRRYMTAIPNSDIVPCPVDASGNPVGGCRGTGICQAFGHIGCWTGSVPSGGAGTSSSGSSGREGHDISNALGKALERGWSLSSCRADSDGDGRTNGEELGDGCCNWPAFPLDAGRAALVSNPGFVSSRTSAASCFGAVPPAPTGLTSTRTTADGGSFALVWDRPDFTAACVCEWEVTITYTAAGASAPTTLTSAVAAPAFVLCASAQGQASVSVAARNQAGLGPTTNTTVSLPVGAAPSSGTPSACSAVLPANTFVNAVGSAAGKAALAALAAPSPATRGVSWVVIPLILVAVSLLVANRWLPARSPLIHLTCQRVAARCCKRGAATHSEPAVAPSGPHPRRHREHPVASCVGKDVPGWLRNPLGDLALGGLGHPLAVAGAVAGLAGATYTTWRYYDWLVYPLGDKLSLYRGAGYALAVSLGLQLIPVARYSPWVALLGVPFEKALIFHRWAGIGTLVLTLLHGVPFLLSYARAIPPDPPARTSPDGPLLPLSYVAQWLPEEAVNPLPGLIAGALVVFLSLTSLPVVRRSCYELFLLGHWAYPAIVVQSMVHLKGSETPGLPVLLPGLFLQGIDLLVTLADALLVRAATLVDAGVCLADGSVVSFSLLAERRASGAVGADPAVDLSSPSCPAVVAAFLVVDKQGANGCWRFSYTAGDYVYLALPAVSPYPHPISISSVWSPGEAMQESGLLTARFSLHVKGMGSGTWSAAVCEKVRSALAAAAADAAPQTGPASAAAAALALPSATRRRAEGPLPSAGSALPPYAAHIPPALLRGLRVAVFGPFGHPSVKPAAYSHHLLVAGGIGITPIAPLHYLLKNGLPLTRAATGTASWFAVDATLHREAAAPAPGISAEGAALTLRLPQTPDGPATAPAPSRARAADAVRVLSLTTAWGVREASLITSFAPLLGLQPPALESAAVAPAPSPASSASSQSIAGPPSLSTAPVPNVRVRLFTGSQHLKGALPAGADAAWSIIRARMDTRAVLMDAARHAVAAEARLATLGDRPPALGAVLAPVYVAVFCCGPNALVNGVVREAAALDGDVFVAAESAVASPDVGAADVESGSAASGSCGAPAPVSASASLVSARVFFHVHRERFEM